MSAHPELGSAMQKKTKQNKNVGGPGGKSGGGEGGADDGDGRW